MNPLRAWNTFWFGPVSARPLGLFRIVFGLIVLANLAYLTVELDYWFTDLGYLRGSEPFEISGPARISLLHWVRDPFWVRVYFAAFAAIAVSYTVGWHTRISGVLLYLGQLSINNRNIPTNSGADTLVMIMTFYMMLAPSGAAFSLDARRAARKRGTPADALIVPWAQRLIQIQLSLIYFVTAVFKCNGASWLNGTAIHYVFSNTEVGRPGLAWLTEYPVFVNVLTHSAIVIEFALVFLLWFRATRLWAIAMGVALHLGIFCAVNILIFGELMTACYLAFLIPDEVNSLLGQLDPRNWWPRRAEARALVLNGRVDVASALAGPHRPVVVRPREHAVIEESA